MMTLSTQIVEKESIPSFQFDYREVLDSEEARARREAQLMRAISMGNTYRRKVNITFATVEGLKTVRTTIWASTRTQLILKNGIHIPLCTVKELELE